MRCRSLVSALAAGVALLCPMRELVAHDVSPTLIQLRPGTRDYILVVDPTGCHADITATSTNPGVVQVFAANMDAANGSLLPGNGTTATVPFRISQVFVVVATSVALSPLTASVNVCWVGEDVGGTGPCQENNCSPPAPHVVQITVDPNATNFGSRPFGGIFGDPVMTATGELRHHEKPLLVRRGPIPFGLEIQYSSRGLADGFAAGRLGPNWRDRFDWRIENTGNSIEISAPDGRLIRFERGFFATAWVATIGADEPFDLIDHAGGLKLRDGRDDRIYTFDSAGVLTKIEDGKGNSLTLTYTSGRLTSVSDGLGRTLTFTYTGSLITQASDGTRIVALSYDASSRLQSLTDPEGGVTNYAYDAAQPAKALLTTRTLPEGNTPWTQVYDGSARVIRQIDAFGAFFDLAFDDVNGKTTTTDPLLLTQEHTHVDGRLTAQKFENGLTASYGADSASRRTTVTDRLSATTTFAHDPASRKIASVTEADGGATRFTWTARAHFGFTWHDLTRATFANGSGESFAYDMAGNVTSRTDALGGTWSRTYDANGGMLSATDATGGTWQYAWTPSRLLDTATDPLGNDTHYLYDALDRLVDIGFADGTMRAATWDDLDRMTSYTDEAGETTTVAWDWNSNLIGLGLPDGATWSFNYDDMDRAIGAIDPDGNSTGVSLDARGRPTSSTNAAGETVSFAWSSGNQLSGVTYGSTGVTRSFDSEDISNAATVAGIDWSYLTDVTGHVTQATDAEGATRRVVRNALGQPIQRFDTYGYRTDIGYDLAARPKSVSIPGTGVSASVSYDFLGHLSTYSRGASTWGIERDAAGGATEFTDPNGRTTTATRDVRGRTDEITFPAALGSVALSYSPKGMLTRLQYSGGVDLQYTYDEMDRPLTANGVTLTRNQLGHVVGCNGITNTRDEVGRILTMTYGVGMTVTYGYDSVGLLTSVEDWLNGELLLGYNADHQLVDRVFPNGVHETREYDTRGWLARICTMAPDMSTIADLRYERDGEGNVTTARLLQPVNGEPSIDLTTRTYDAAGEDLSFAHDALGRRISDQWGTFTYDGASRLIAATDWVDSFSYGWNGFGNVETLDNLTVSGALHWNYATDNPSVAKTVVNGVDDKCWVATPKGELLWSIDFAGSARTVYHFDLYGNTAFTTDGAGAVVNARAYSTNGQVLATLGPASSYPFGEFTVKGEQFAVSIGSGIAFRDRIWDVDTGSTLQPVRAPEWVLQAKATYGLSFFPQGLAESTEKHQPYALAIESSLDPLRGTGRLDFDALPYGTKPADAGTAGDPRRQVPFHPKGLTLAECAACHLSSGPFAAAYSYLAATGGRQEGFFGLRPGQTSAPIEEAFVSFQSWDGTFKGNVGTAGSTEPDPDERNLRRAIKKAIAFERLGELEEFLFATPYGALAFLDAQFADRVMENYDELLDDLEELGATDARKSFRDYLTDPDGLGLRSGDVQFPGIGRFGLDFNF